MSDDVEAIVRGLTKAQRAMLIGARETVLMDRMKCAGRSKVLRRKRLTVQAWRGGDLLTEAGIAVRTALLSQAKE